MRTTHPSTCAASAREWACSALSPIRWASDLGDFAPEVGTVIRSDLPVQKTEVLSHHICVGGIRYAAVGGL